MQVNEGMISPKFIRKQGKQLLMSVVKSYLPQPESVNFLWLSKPRF